MRLKRKQVNQVSAAKARPPRPGRFNQVRGQAGNQTLIRRLNRGEEPHQVEGSPTTHSSRFMGRETNGKNPIDSRKHATRIESAEEGISGSGRTLPAGLRGLFEKQYGGSFSDVRIHVNPRAAQAASRLGAAAYTMGRDIAFGSGFYAPHTGSGLRLLSHELAHVAQSRGGAEVPLRDGEQVEALEPLEREAEQLSNSFGRGRPAIQQRQNHRVPLCHPVFISSHGEQGYLDNAAEFYAAWGGTTVVRGVPSIEDLLSKLASQSSIGHITIVSHAHEKHITMQFIGGPPQVEKDDWKVDAPGKVFDLERHLVQPATVDTIIKYVNIAGPTNLQKIPPVTDPLVRQFIWWIAEQEYITGAGFSAPFSLKMSTFARTNADIYRNRILASGKVQQPGAGSGSAPQPVNAGDLATVEQMVRDQAKRWPWAKPKMTEEFGLSRRLSESPTVDIQRVNQNPKFFADLATVRSKIRTGDWIEIQGCSVGKDRGYLENVRDFFGGAQKPKVSAPDWFQAFGHYGSLILDGEKFVEAQWKDPLVQAALKYWYPIITGKALSRRVNYVTLLSYLKAGHVLPLAAPDIAGRGVLMVWKDVGEKAFLTWISKHAYQITKIADIKARMFITRELKENVKAVPVDWLEERMASPSKMVFRVQKAAYDSHIISVS